MHMEVFMLRKCTDEDINDEECEIVIDPFMIIMIVIWKSMLFLKL